MNEERMERIMTLLEALPDVGNVTTSGFHMSHWEYHTSCGTTLCAGGAMMNDPWCQEQGLKRIVPVGVEEDFEPIHPQFEGQSGFSGLSRFLDITYEDSISIFDPYSYYKQTPEITKEEVISRIREIIAKYS